MILMLNNYRILGTKINLLTIEQLNNLIVTAVNLNLKWIIANHNLNSLYLYYHDSSMRSFYRSANYTHIDGMALVFLGKLLKIPCQRKHRVTYADWIWYLMEEANSRSWRVFYLGSKATVVNKGAQVLKNKYPNLQIATTHGYFSFDSKEATSVLNAINEYRPNVLMVGMGMPRQEKWILNNLEDLKANVILPSGACIDYVAGEIATPPRWMGRVGIEWLYRLIVEPRRLWKRYLLEPWFVARLFIRKLTKYIRYQFKIFFSFPLKIIRKI